MKDIITDPMTSPPGKIIREKTIPTDIGMFTLTVSKEDMGQVYPGLERFCVHLSCGDRNVAFSCTNSYEYTPTSPLNAETVAIQKAESWEQELHNDTDGFIATLATPGGESPRVRGADVLIIEGSPRAGGNCSILATWAAEEAELQEKTTRVVYLDDLSIRACIGCYQCYNTGACTFEDDMTTLLDALDDARYLIICTPVYTSTVPGILKIFIDRCLAYHAKRMLEGTVAEKKGILLSVSGRTGMNNFVCVTRVIHDFMRNLGIIPFAEVLVDGVDRSKDIRKIPGVGERVRVCIRETVGNDPPSLR